MKNFLERVLEVGSAGRKKDVRKSNRTRQRNKGVASKVESNDSLEIPNSAETSDIPGLPFGVCC